MLNKMGFLRVIVVFNGISLDIYKPSNIFSKYKRSDFFILLYIGKIHQLKGLDYIIKALTKVKFKYEFLVAGPDDGFKSYLEDIIKKENVRNVYFLGYVNENQKAELYRFADLFIHPSLSEGFSMSILDAMKYKVPVLITDACNFPNVKTHNAGFVISNDNLKNNLIKKLNQIYHEKNYLNKIGEKGRDLIEKSYSIKSMTEEVADIYRGILSV